MLIKTNSKGHLVIGNCDAVSLAKKFKTPLYVIDEELFRNKCREYKHSFSKYYPDFDIAYAGKANLCKKICRIIQEENLSLDCSSGGEIYTAKVAGFAPSKIYFHGNNKSKQEIELALNLDIGRFVVDNEDELNNINGLCKKLKKTANILLRITPNVKPDVHTYIQTGQLDSKFGIQIGKDALNLISKIIKQKNIILKGLHCHIGSQILKIAPFELASNIMLSFIKEIKEELNFEIRELNLGGGLGIVYTKENNPPSIDEFAKRICNEVIKNCKEYNLKQPKIIIEPGRSIVGEAGITLYTIGSIKEIKGIRKYVAIDGGMPDNPRPALYNSVYSAIIANKANFKPEEIVSIAGKTCESGDMLIWDIKLPKCEAGDILAVFSTGAYNYSMSSNYNRLPRPAMIFVRKNKVEVGVRREEYDDVIKCDI